MENTYTYEITENGYYILINGKKVIHQYEPYIPNKSLSYEENAKVQIEELKASEEAQKEEKSDIEQMKSDITDIQLALTELYEMGVQNMAKIYYSLIRKGLKTIEDVPEILKKEVQNLLDSEEQKWKKKINLWWQDL